MGNDLRDYRVTYMTWYLELYFIWLLLIFSLPNNNHWTRLNTSGNFWLHHFGASSPRHNLCDSDWSSVAIDNPQGPTYLAVTPLNSNVLEIVEEFLPLIHYRVAWVACHRPCSFFSFESLANLGPRCTCPRPAGRQRGKGTWMILSL